MRSIITLAKVLGLNVIAEGVETEAQRDVLDALGCDGFQGYLFARPLAIAAFIDRLEALRLEHKHTVPEAGDTKTSGHGKAARRDRHNSARHAVRYAQSANAG